MFTVICFFLPLILFLVTIPLKVALASLELTLGAIEQGKKGTLLERLENWSEEPDSLGSDLKKIGSSAKSSVALGGKALKIGGKTIKLGGKAIKVSAKTVKVAVKVTIASIKATIRFIKTVIVLIKALVAFLLSLGVVGVIILVIIVLILVVACVACVLLFNSGALNGSGSTKDGFKGYDYSQIDWSQDFSAKLDELEASQGKQARDWAELVIISMNTSNKNSGVAPPIQNWWAGFKRVESSVTVMTESQKTEHPMTDYSYVDEKGNHASCFGPMQIKLPTSKPIWTKFNSIYTPKNTSPSADTRDDTYGNIFFYPDCALGTLTEFNKELGAEANIDYISDAFTKAGATESAEKRDRVLYTLSAVAYNSGSIPSSSGSDKAKMVEAVAIYTIRFFEKYGYEYNEQQVNLVNSIAQAQKQNMSTPAPETDGFRNALVGWDVSRSDFSACYATSNDYGVLDEKGNKVSGSLVHYVMQDASSDVQSFVKEGMQIYWGKGDNETMPYYGMFVYICSLYSVDKTVDVFGLRNAVVVDDGSSSGSGDGGSLLSVISSACNPNKLTYVLGGDGKGQADCARFVARILTKAGYNAFGITASNHSGDPSVDNFGQWVSEACSNGGGVDCSSETTWIKANQPQAIVWQGGGGGLQLSSLQPGDVCYKGGEHVVIYVGKNSGGVECIAQAAHTNATSCSTTMDDLSGGYSVGYSNFYCQGQITFVFRPSLLK